MSEQGWREFLSADDVDDWVVLHGGPTAVFKVGSLQQAAQHVGVRLGAPSVRMDAGRRRRSGTMGQ